jgi:hypothetical protein
MCFEMEVLKMSWSWRVPLPSRAQFLGFELLRKEPMKFMFRNKKMSLELNYIGIIVFHTWFYCTSTLTMRA